MPDRYAEHFDRALTAGEAAALAAGSGADAGAPLVTDGGWEHSDVRKRAVISASRAVQARGPVAAPLHFEAFGAPTGRSLCTC